MLPYITEVVHSYLPKWCTTICRSGAFLIAEFGALLFADHTNPSSAKTDISIMSVAAVWK